MGQVTIPKDLWEQLPPVIQQAVVVGVSPDVALGEPVEQTIEGELHLVWDDPRIPAEDEGEEDPGGG
jgi:hypothetical protein